MKKVKLILISITAYFLFGGNGCNKRVYDSLINYNSPIPILYEQISNKDTINKFIGGDIRYSKGNWDKEDLALLRLNFNYITTKDNAFSNTSFIVYGGFYNVDGLRPGQGANFTDINFDGKKWGGGIFGNVKVGLNFKLSNFKLGSGIDFSAGNETGEFLDFRRSAKELGVIDSDRDWAFASFNVFLFGAYQFQNSSILNFQFNIGKPGMLTPIISYQKNGTVVWLSYSYDRGNFGVMTSLGDIF